MDTTYLDLPSPTSPLSSASTRVGSGHSPISLSKYIPGKATAWWKTGAGSGINGEERIGERMGGGLGDEDGVLSDSMVSGNGIGGVRQEMKMRIRSVVEMAGMVFVVLTLVGFVVACLGWMHAGSGPKEGKDILGRREDIFGGREWYYEP